MIDNNILFYKIEQKALEINKNPKDIMQMYFFERLLERISLSPFKKNFILKGGLLLSAIIGRERRTSNDMDTMVKGLDIEGKIISNILQRIAKIDCNDDITFEVVQTKEIREDDIYGGTNVTLVAKKEDLVIPLSIDVTTKDPITPHEIEFGYKCLLDDKIIPIMAFNKETIIAEKFIPSMQKVESNVNRIKDFFDLYILLTEFKDEIDPNILQKAIYNTCRRRDCLSLLDELYERFNIIQNSEILALRWKEFQILNPSAQNISFAQINEILNEIIRVVEKDTKRRTKNKGQEKNQQN